MNAHELLTDDGHAVLLLCSAVGNQAEAGGPSPFTLSEWNQLARALQASSLKRPAALFGQAAAALAPALQISLEEAERIARLLDRNSKVALTLENLFARGLWVVTRADPGYPAKIRATLKHQAPSVLFGAGELSLLGKAGIAVVGSRALDEAGALFAQQAGKKISAARLPVVSGGARGTDRVAMQAGLEAGGTAVCALADSLVNTARLPEVREYLLDGKLLLLTPFGPEAGFSVGTAMGRNKLIYGLADFAIVVSSDLEKGGTWAGAIEALKAEWCPVFVRAADSAPRGNQALIKKGALALNETTLAQTEDLPETLRELAKARPAKAAPDLFEFAAQGSAAAAKPKPK